MITLANIRETTATLRPARWFMARKGVGKTTLAAKCPSPVFLQTEDGMPAGLKLATFSLLQSYADVREARWRR